jgi:hypothetical protein
VASTEHIDNQERAMTIKLQCPPNTGGFSHGGESYAPDDDGIIEVPDQLAGPALTHGFSPYAEPQAKEKLAKNKKAEAADGGK